MERTPVDYDHRALLTDLGLFLAAMFLIRTFTIPGLGYMGKPTHGLSGAIVTGIIGLILGFAYVAFGRNLWALIIAHCFLNSMSMVERFFGTSWGKGSSRW
jgi:hypothetical protein